MQSLPPPRLQRRLFLVWILALAACLTLFVWAFHKLDAEQSAGSGKTAEGKVGGAPEKGASAAPADGKSWRAPVPPFDPDKAEYVLTAFSTQGMRHVTDAEPAWSMLRPGNILVAQLIRRGPTPAVVSGKENVRVRYTLDAPYAGNGNAPAAQGELKPQDDGLAFASAPIAVMPYTADGGFAPYPTARVEALAPDGRLLAETRVVLPVSTEIGCRNCHTGPWKKDGKAGISEQTAGNILETHDRRSNTHLKEQADKGETVNCLSCHGITPEAPNLSAAVHGFHATMKLKGAEACASCHPSSETGGTRFFRDFHSLWGLDCTRCHGRLEDHALSLLKAEAEKGNTAAARRMSQILPLAEAKDIAPRAPWINLPDCKGCHNFTVKPDSSSATAVGKWTKNSGELYANSLDNTGNLRCPSCHGAPHAVYPASGPDGDDRDNIQPTQYQKMAAPLGKDGNCAVCHTIPMDYFIHHDRVE